jgi:hypothetical protein
MSILFAIVIRILVLIFPLPPLSTLFSLGCCIFFFLGQLNSHLKRKLNRMTLEGTILGSSAGV